jgi:hypothetical protein
VLTYWFLLLFVVKPYEFNVLSLKDTNLAIHTSSNKTKSVGVFSSPSGLGQALTTGKQQSQIRGIKPLS